MTTLPPTTPAPTTPAPTTPEPQPPHSPDFVPREPPVVIPTACIIRISPTQIHNATHIEWELDWPEGAYECPEEIRQYIERSQHPNGPFKRIGMVPGPRTFFIDVSADYGTMVKDWYYRIRCKRVVR